MTRVPKSHIHCKDCALFTFDVPEDGPRKPLFFKRGLHGLCRGAPGHPSHIEHRDSLRCVWFVSKDQHKKDTALPADHTRGRSKLFKT